MSFAGPWDKNWEVIEKGFGKGGQGTTHLVRRRDAPHEGGVLKVLQHNKSTQARGRMHREVASLQAMGTAGGFVPQVFEHNTEQLANDKIQLYVIMSQAKGITLKELVDKQDRLSLDDAIAVARGICRTIRIGHGEDILHRDIKPQNLIVDPENVSDVTIVDYGLSFNAADPDDGLTRMSENFGNEFFNLPETHTPGGNHRDPRSDVTAICGILYYCVSGQRPGQLRDENNLPPHRCKGRSTSEALAGDFRCVQLDSTLDRAFALDLAGRIESIASLTEKLDSILAGPSEFPDDPSEVIERATQLIRTVDKKVVMAEYQKKAKEIVQKVSVYVNKLQQGTKGKSILVSFLHSADSIVPSGYEKINVGCAVRIGVEHHTHHKIVYFCFGLKGNRCHVLRIVGTPSKQTRNQTQKMQLDSPVEIMSIARDENPDFQPLEQELNGQINEITNYITKIITGQTIF